MSYLDSMCHIASALEALAFFQTDMVRLRAIEVIAMSALSAYSLMHTDGDILNCHFIWSTLHAIINASRLAIVAYHYLSVEVTDDESKLLSKGGVFDIFNRSEFAVLKQGFEWVNINPRERLTQFGEDVEYLYLLVNGTVKILNNKDVAFATVKVRESVDVPQFIGELSFFTQKPASASVMVHEKCKGIRWKMSDIRKAATIEGHSLKASVYRQLPSLFSKQIARRLANDERGLAQKHKQEEQERKKKKKKTSRLSFLGITKVDSSSNGKVVPSSSLARQDSPTERKSQRTSILGQIKKILVKRISSSSTSSSLNQVEESKSSETTSTIERTIDTAPPGVGSSRNSFSRPRDYDDKEKDNSGMNEEHNVLRRSIYGSQDGTSLFENDDDADSDDDDDLMKILDEVTSSKKVTSTNPYAKPALRHVETSANPYAR